MCGYYGNTHECPEVIDLMNQLRLPLYPTGQQYVMREVDGLVTAAPEGYQFGKAIWWYALKWDKGQLVPNAEITSFNARNLESRMWREPINERRAVVFATEIGETQGKSHYLMKARTPLAMGALYQDYLTDAGPVRSFALITRPAHPEFAKFHEKAMPLFLPLEQDVIEKWLDPAVPAEDPQIRHILEHPRITSDLDVIPVGTFKRGEPIGPAQVLRRDPV